jgi:hypothetical protein
LRAIELKAGEGKLAISTGGGCAGICGERRWKCPE